MDLSGFKRKLEEEKARLEGEMKSVGRPNPAVPGDWEPMPNDLGNEADPVDQAEIVTNREENAAILSDLEARHGAVLGALKRIDEGNYGKCEVDGGPIEEARLLADPAATTCRAHL